MFGAFFYVMKEIKLTRGYVAIVDDEDFEKLSKFKWKADVRKSGLVYAKRFVEKNIDGIRYRRSFYLHRDIMEAIGGGDLIDHENGCPLDCRRDNLRPCDYAQNNRNSKVKSIRNEGIKGVYLRPSGRWAAQITFNYKNICIGTFDTIELAALAYDKMAIELFGDFARTNFKQN